MTIDTKAILAQVQANRAALEGCAGPHDFSESLQPGRLGGKWRCTRCGGEVDFHARHWYQAGLKHGVRP